MKSPKTVHIVGAGPVGSLWAILLRQKGFEVRVFEKRSDPRTQNAAAGRSINLIVTSRGINALQKAGLTSLIHELAVPVFGRMIHTKAGETAYQAYGQKNECNYSISRSGINNSLISSGEKIGVQFFFDHSLADVESQKKELVFENGRRTSYDLLFGADGSGSQLRKFLVQSHPQVQDQTHWLEADYKELTLPLAAGIPQIKTDALHIWPRGAHMMMALANKDGSFTVTIYLPKNSVETRSNWGFDKIQSDLDIQKLFETEFPDAVKLMPNYLNEFKLNPQGRMGTVRCSQWVFDSNVALIGDAAHAIVPFFGQGMNCGFEDCSSLFDLFEKYEGNWPVVLAEYEKSQKPNADAIADMALENWIEMKEKVADPRFLLRKKIEAALEQKYPGIFKSRYGLITYTLVPYALAQKAGEIQGELIDQLMIGVEKVEDISWSAAEKLVETKWKKFLRENSVDIKTFNT